MFFVDAAHFVFGTFLCCLWSFQRIFVRAASGRQRFNVLGEWNAVTRELIAVTNTTVVNTETMCELLRKIAALGLTGPITLVLDNALSTQRRGAGVGDAVGNQAGRLKPRSWISASRISWWCSGRSVKKRIDFSEEIALFGVILK